MQVSLYVAAVVDETDQDPPRYAVTCYVATPDEARAMGARVAREILVEMPDAQPPDVYPVSVPEEEATVNAPKKPKEALMPWLPPAEAADALGISTGTLRYRARLEEQHPLFVRRNAGLYLVGESIEPDLTQRRRDAMKAAGFTFDRDGDLLGVPQLGEEPSREEPVEELLERRAAAFARMGRSAGQRVHRIERRGPFGVVHMGDPHVDDDGCDWPELLRTVRAVKTTPGLYAGNIGDTVNNWVGRLVEKYKHQTSTEKEAFRLARWLLREIPWDYVLLGNHDHWNQGGMLLDEYARGAEIKALEDHEARIVYVDGDQSFQINARHDYKGHSLWNKLHGLVRRSKMRPEAQLYVAGHRHCWGQFSEEGYDGHPVWALRVRGFKRFDEYAAAKDFYEDKLGPAITTVFRLHHPHPGERLKVFHDVEEAAEFLGWCRAKGHR